MLGVLAACHDDDNRAKGKRSGGSYKVDKDAATEPDAAKDVDRRRRGDRRRADALPQLRPRGGRGRQWARRPRRTSSPRARAARPTPRACFSVEQYLDLLFGQSDTNMTVLVRDPDPGAGEPAERWRHGAGPPAGRRAVRRRAGAPARRRAADRRPAGHADRRDEPAPAATIRSRRGRSTRTRPARAGGSTTTTRARRRWARRSSPGSRRSGRTSSACTRASRAAASTRRPSTSGPRPRAHPDIRFVVYHSGFESSGDRGPVHRGDRRAGRQPAGHDAATRRRRPGRERLRGARFDVVGADARPDAGRARARQAAGGGRARTACCGAPTRSGTAHRRTRSRRSARSRSRPSCRSSTATRRSPRRSSARSSARTRSRSTGSSTVPDQCAFTRDELAAAAGSSMTAAWRTYGPETDRELVALLADHGMV